MPNSKTILVTGATSGIGFATASQLAAKGCKLILSGSDPTKVERAVDLVNQLYPQSSIGIHCDLSSMESVRTFCLNIRHQFKELNGIIFNAGCVSSERMITIDGFELQLAVNHLSSVLISHYLIPMLTDNKSSRIIFVSSRAHARGAIYFNDIQLESDYQISKAYNQSKLMNLLFCFYLSEKLRNTGITVNAFHPGLVNTSFGNKHVNRMHNLAWNAMKWMGRSPEKAAEDAVFLATSNDVGGISGKYFHSFHMRRASRTALDAQLQKRIWDISLKLLNLRDDEYGASI